MATLRELENKADALFMELQTEISQNEEKIKVLQQCNTRLHKGMNRKLSSISRLIQKAAEADAKRLG